MRLRVTDTVIIGGKVIEPGIGNFDPNYAAELMKIGSAYEVKADGKAVSQPTKVNGEQGVVKAHTRVVQPPKKSRGKKQS